MSKSLKGTKTLENLMKAFAGESQARTRYTYYATVAKKHGYVQIANIFMETAENEKEHAKRFMKCALMYSDGKDNVPVDIRATYPFAYSDTDTLMNLKMAAQGEHEEWSDLYDSFSKTAIEEGFADIARVFSEIAKVEEHHEKRYLKLAKNIENETLYKKDSAVEWKCDNCGYIHHGKEAPKSCPACAHPQNYFEVFVETY